MRACWRTSPVWAVLVVVVLCGWAQERQEYLPQKIVFSGSTLSQAELLAFTGLRAGVPLTQDRIQAATDKLTATGLFSTGRFGFDGETLTFELAPSAAVVPVEYANFPWWDDPALNAAVAARVPLFHGGLNPGGPMRDAVGAALTQLVAAKGIAGASITTTPVADEAGNQTAIRYHIDSPPVVVEAFHVYDYSGVWTQPLEAVEKSAAGMSFTGSTREKLADAVRAVYGRVGFIGMTMTTPAWGKPQVENGRIEVPIQASITSEGGQYHVAGIHVQGDGGMTEEPFAKSAKLHPGDVANEELWAQTQAAVKASFRAQGYLDAKTDGAQTLDRANHTVDYTLTVEPGAEYRMGALTLVNLSDEQKAELMPYWLLHQGDPFNPDLISASVANYRKSVAPGQQTIHAGFAAKWTADQDAHTVDVVVTFEQARD